MIRKMNESLNSAKKDIVIILSISFLSAILYITLGGMLMNYGHGVSHSLLFRFLPVFLIQFGMSCLGVIIVLFKNKETLSKHGLVRKNILQSFIGCLIVSIPTVAFLFITNDILSAPIPFNAIGYLVIALTWGLEEGLILIFFIVWNAL